MILPDSLTFHDLGDSVALRRSEEGILRSPFHRIDHDTHNGKDADKRSRDTAEWVSLEVGIDRIRGERDGQQTPQLAVSAEGGDMAYRVSSGLH